MNLFPLFVVLVIAALFAYHHYWGRFAFLVRIRDGHPQPLKGRVHRGFLESLASLCRDAGLERGMIAAVQEGNRFRFVFSRTIDPGVRQQVRNLWYEETRV